MEVDLERWGGTSEPPRRVQGASARSLSRGSGWRRSGDDRYWESLVSEVEVQPHAPRPQSCIGGIGLEDWLQQLERTRGPAPARAKTPPLSDRTVSMPALHGGTPCQHYPGPALSPGRGRGPHKPPGQCETPLGSEEGLFAPAGQWETARFWSSPRPEPVRISALASVKNGWLPVQKRAVLCDITCQAPPPKESTAQDQYNPSIVTSIPKYYMKKNGLDCTEGNGRDKSSMQANCMDPSARWLSGQASPNIMQAWNLAPQAGDSPLIRKKGWEKRREAFFSDGTRSADHDVAPRRQSPLHRTGSTPAPSRGTAPPSGLEALPTKPEFSTIMGTAQRIPRSYMSPSSSGATAKSDEPTSSAPPGRENPAAAYPGEPVMRRRQVSVIKVTDAGRGRRGNETGPGLGQLRHRHSCGDADRKENARSGFYRQGGVDPARASAHAEGPPGSANAAQHPRRPRSCSLAGGEGGSGEKMYRSTLSLYLCRPSSDRTWDGTSGRPPRPLSFAGAFRHSDPSLGGAPDPVTKRPSCAPPPVKANTGCATDATCSVNTGPPSACQPGTATCRSNTESPQQDVGSRLGLGPHPGLSWSQPSAAVKPQAVSPTINSEDQRIDVGLTGLSSFPESGEHQSAEAILALNAASIIANIKLQTRINKMASLLSEQESKKLPQPGNEKVEDAGSHESRPPDGGVVRRAEGNTQRKARPHPIHWQEPLYDQQEDNGAPLTLREALELLRPDFIRRSRRRVKEVEHRARKRRAQQVATLEPARRTRRTCRPGHNPIGDNHSKPADRASAGNELLPRPNRANSSAPGMKRNRQEEKKKAVLQTNRLRAAAFKKKLLDQILRRKMD